MRASVVHSDARPPAPLAAAASAADADDDKEGPAPTLFGCAIPPWLLKPAITVGAGVSFGGSVLISALLCSRKEAMSSLKSWSGMVLLKWFVHAKSGWRFEMMCGRALSILSKERRSGHFFRAQLQYR